ncbi:hypothetical protein PV325_004757 [Microctonus aethiopoides]|nr:hypothetical protein PV325_004757 [Microctonus aethiopoides]
MQLKFSTTDSVDQRNGGRRPGRERGRGRGRGRGQGRERGRGRGRGRGGGGSGGSGGSGSERGRGRGRGRRRGPSRGRGRGLAHCATTRGRHLTCTVRDPSAFSCKSLYNLWWSAQNASGDAKK